LLFDTPNVGFQLIASGGCSFPHDKWTVAAIVQHFCSRVDVYACPMCWPQSIDEGMWWNDVVIPEGSMADRMSNFHSHSLHRHAKQPFASCIPNRFFNPVIEAHVVWNRS
jgi:hypothetical protein